MAAAYDQAFGGSGKLVVPSRAKNSNHVFHQYTLLCEGISRDGLKAFLEENDVPAMIYYPVPLHMQKAYTDERYQNGDFPVTEHLCDVVISLPMHTEMQDDQLNHIITTVQQYLNK